ncbi:hypothetical protein GCM10008020_06260 [Massilia psychrophila]|nr:hypothetical protein GCM10008020_06260 [Massilia psychrophila]
MKRVLMARGEPDDVIASVVRPVNAMSTLVRQLVHIVEADAGASAGTGISAKIRVAALQRHRQLQRHPRAQEPAGRNPHRRMRLGGLRTHGGAEPDDYNGQNRSLDEARSFGFHIFSLVNERPIFGGIFN